MLSNISDLFTMASLVICMLLSGIIFYYLRTRINMLEQSVMDQAQLLQQVVTSIKSSQFRQMGLQQQQQQQQQNNDGVEKCPASLENNDYSQHNSTIKLIQVSDDSESSDDDNDSDDDSYDDDDNNDHELYYSGGNSNGGSKIIDLSTITSSSPMSFLPLTKSDDIKVIELKSNIKLNDESDQSDDSDESDESDESDQSDDSDESENDHDDDNDDDDQDNDDNDNGNNANVNENCNENNNENETNRNGGNSGNNNRNFKSIVIEEDATNNLSFADSNILSLDKMKNMPVNTLRNLAKKKT